MWLSLEKDEAKLFLYFVKKSTKELRSPLQVKLSTSLIEVDVELYFKTLKKMIS
jgi:hypothetical protein